MLNGFLLMKLKTVKALLETLKMSEEIKYPLIAAINGLGCEKIVDKGWMVVHAPKAPSQY